MLRSKAAFLEQALLIVLAALATMYVERLVLFTPHLYAGDAMLLEYWMRRFQDPGLFQDPLTHALVQTGYVPLGSQAVYWLASNVVDPIRFGAWGVLVLAPLSTWLVFRIVREHTAWIPAAWLAAALYVLSWENQRFSGTHPRAFAQPIVLLTVFLLLRGRTRWAAAVSLLSSAGSLGCEVARSPPSLVIRHPRAWETFTFLPTLSVIPCSTLMPRRDCRCSRPDVPGRRLVQ